MKIVICWGRILRSAVGLLFILLTVGVAIVGCRARPTEVSRLVSPTSEICVEIPDMVETKPEAFRYDSERNIYEIILRAIEATPLPGVTPGPLFTPAPTPPIPHAHPEIKRIKIPRPDDDPELESKLKDLLGAQYPNRFSTEPIQIPDGLTLKVRGELCDDVLSVYESADLLIQ